jgi:hypothetical protein
VALVTVRRTRWVRSWLRRGSGVAWLGVLRVAWLGVLRVAWLGVLRVAWLGVLRVAWLGVLRVAWLGVVGVTWLRSVVWGRRGLVVAVDWLGRVVRRGSGLSSVVTGTVGSRGGLGRVDGVRRLVVLRLLWGAVAVVVRRSLGRVGWVLCGIGGLVRTSGPCARVVIVGLCDCDRLGVVVVDNRLGGLAVRRRRVDGHVLAGDGVNTGLSVCLDLIFGLAAVVEVLVLLRPLSALVLLDVDWLVLVTLVAETGAAVTGERVLAHVIVNNLMNQLVQLIPDAGRVLCCGGGSTVATDRGGVVSEGLFLVVDSDVFLVLCDGDRLLVVVVDHGRHILVVFPLVALLAAVSCGNTGRVGLVLSGDRDRRLSVSRRDHWGVGLGTVTSMSSISVGLSGCCGRSEDDSVLHCVGDGYSKLGIK